MVKYTLDNIEGLVFRYSASIYKIHKSKGQLEHIMQKESIFFDYSHHFNDVVIYLNNGSYKVITQPEKVIDLW